jgi:hypothetical protein
MLGKKIHGDLRDEVTACAIIDITARTAVKSIARLTPEANCVLGA